MVELLFFEPQNNEYQPSCGLDVAAVVGEVFSLISFLGQDDELLGLGEQVVEQVRLGEVGERGFDDCAGFLVSEF